jgi:hypothetical protein
MLQLVIRYTHSDMFGGVWYDVEYIKVSSKRRLSPNKVIEILQPHISLNGTTLQDVECELYCGGSLVDAYAPTR